MTKGRLSLFVDWLAPKALWQFLTSQRMLINGLPFVPLLPTFSPYTRVTWGGYGLINKLQFSQKAYRGFAVHVIATKSVVFWRKEIFQKVEGAPFFNATCFLFDIHIWQCSLKQRNGGHLDKPLWGLIVEALNSAHNCGHWINLGIVSSS